jgi:hypothetical protein
VETRDALKKLPVDTCMCGERAEARYKDNKDSYCNSMPGGQNSPTKHCMIPGDSRLYSDERDPRYWLREGNKDV